MDDLSNIKTYWIVHLITEEVKQLLRAIFQNTNIYKIGRFFIWLKQSLKNIMK